MKRAPLILALLTTLTFPLAVSAAPQDESGVLDGACMAALDLCSVNCTALGDGVEALSCVTRCNQAAALCLGDEEPTLSSEEYLAHWGDALVLKSSPTCNDTTPCPPEYGSCGSWSGFYDCGDPFCGISTLCKRCDEWGQCTAGGPAMKQNRERYRVCFNAQMQGCTEYQRGVQTLGCGC